VKHRAFVSGWGTLFVRFGPDLNLMTSFVGPVGRSARAQA
jgi:hypothetical protein